jgi:PAS domain S-box-containing protein
VLVARDVTAARAAQKAVHEQNALLEQHVQERTAELLENRDRLQSIINNIPVLIAYVDADQRYTFFNQPYLERFAPGHSDITGQTVRDILGEQRYAIASPLIAKALQGEPQRYDWRPYPGVWQVINYLPKRDAQGEVAGYFVFGIDITERKLAEEKIQLLNTDLGKHVERLERSTRALRTLSVGNRTMVRAMDEQSLLGSMCRAIVDAGGYPVATVWYRNLDEGKTLRPMAGVGSSQGLSALHRLKTTWADNAQGCGPGRAQWANPGRGKHAV